MSRTTGELCQPSRVDHPRSSPLRGETCYYQRPSIPATHPARQASCANLSGQTTRDFHFSIAKCAMTRSRVHPGHPPRTTGESCPLSRAGHLRPSPFLHGKTSYGPRVDQPSQAKLTNSNFFLTESVTA
ncbi:hypothetical protein CDL15_Pgr022203 [Punica granatum]|uniref:Uncharacterized protein n=1 Tax=Punica granatum TaxID=22663 RepID=A0A218Y2Y8_PUNGR|nr:hypothetical protein CDL15_Pgr022203 [Punica granatum]